MKTLSRRKTLTVLIVVMIGFASPLLYSHCQIPCAIYDDSARLKMIEENITTLEKAMKQIQSLTEGQPSNYNQLVRWINNKDEHADMLMETVTDYFMTQRLKPAAADSSEYQKYIRQLTLLHEMLVASMHCKQTTDLKYVEELRQLLKDFTAAYQQ